MEYLKKEFDFELISTKEEDDYFSFEGYASTKDIDLVDDIVLPEAFKNDLDGETPMLWQHYRSEPIGVFREKRIDEKGLFVRGFLPKDDTFVSGRVMPQMKIKSIRSMSIGFSIKKSTYDTETNIRIISEASLKEISLVTFPANPAAMVTGMKAMEKIEAVKEGRIETLTISKDDLFDLPISDLKFAIRRGLLSKDAASFVSGLIIGFNRETAKHVKTEKEQDLLVAIANVFKGDKL